MTRFTDFWDTYPKGRRSNKKGCESKWKQKNLDEKADEIIEDVRWRAKYHKPWVDGFIPMPATYLNQERWNDDRVDVRDEKKAKQAAPAAPQHARDEGPHFNRWERAANRILWKVAYGERGFEPLGEERLQRMLDRKQHVLDNFAQMTPGEDFTEQEFVSRMFEALREEVRRQEAA